jgi:hypothetical protein
METINAFAQTSGALAQAPIDILNASVATVPELLLTPLRLITEGLTTITGASAGLFEGFWGSLNAFIMPVDGLLNSLAATVALPANITPFVGPFLKL